MAICKSTHTNLHNATLNRFSNLCFYINIYVLTITKEVTDLRGSGEGTGRTGRRERRKINVNAVLKYKILKNV